METVFHIVKAAVLAVMMYFSLIFLGFPAKGAVIFSLVPLLLGLLNVFVGFAYGLTGFIFILACGTALLPQDWKTKAEDFLNKIEEQGAKPKKPATSTPEPKTEVTPEHKNAVTQ